MEPFRQLPFEDLPLLPRVPHPWAELAARHVLVDTAAWGRVDVAFRTLGSGPPLLLVHGLMTAGYSWRYVLLPLARHYTVYVPDLPGSGASAAPADRTGPMTSPRPSVPSRSPSASGAVA